MAHLRYFGLSNFKVFSDEQNFELKPITILTGTNSSGKSSVIKGMKVMQFIFGKKDNFLSNNNSMQFLKNIELTNIKNVGNFNLLKNNVSKNNEIHFRLPLEFSNQFNKMVLELTYEGDGSKLNNAKLKQVEVSLKNTEIILYNYTNIFKEPTWFQSDFWKLELNVIKLRELYFEFIKELLKYRIQQHQLEKELLEKGKFNGNEHEIGIYIEHFDDLIIENSILKNTNLEIYDWYRNSIKELKLFSGNLPYFDENIIHNNKFILPYPFLFEKQELINSLKDKIDEDLLLQILDLHDKVSKMEKEEKKMFFNELLQRETMMLARYFSNNDLDIQNGSKIDNYLDIFRSNRINNLNKLHFKNVIGTNFEKMDDIRSTLYDSKTGDTYAEEYLNALDNILNDDFFIKYKIKKEIILPIYFEDKLKSNGFNDFMNKFCRGGVDNGIMENIISFRSMSFVPSIRTQQQRNINLTKDDFLSETIFEFYNIKHNQNALKFLDDYISIFGIAEKIDLSFNEDSLITNIILIKSGLKYNLVDVGYGMSQLIPILLKITCEISKNIGQDDYGTFYHRPISIVIEEPETNLHPQLQSKLADMLIECNKGFNIQFIIETHSEYLIRKLQFLIAKNEFSFEDANIYYFNNPESEDFKDEAVYEIKIDKYGAMSRPFGTGFFDESEKIAVELFLLKKDQQN